MEETSDCLDQALELLFFSGQLSAHVGISNPGPQACSHLEYLSEKGAGWLTCLPSKPMSHSQLIRGCSRQPSGSFTGLAEVE